MDVHPGREQNIAPAVRHLLREQGEELLHQRFVEGTRERDAVRQKRTRRCQPDPGGTVCCDNGGHALFAQRFQNAADCAGVAFGAEGTVHRIVAARDRFEFVERELRDERVKRRFAVFDVGELDAAIAGLRQIGGQVAQDPVAQRDLPCRGAFCHRNIGAVVVFAQHQALERVGRVGGADLAALAHDLQRADGEHPAKRGGPHVKPDIKIVVAFFKDPRAAVAAQTRVIVAREIRQLAAKAELFAFARKQRLGFGERDQDAFRLREDALRFLKIELDDLFAAVGVARIRHGDPHAAVVAGDPRLRYGDVKRRVAQPVAERVQHPRRRERFKEAVANKDIFVIFVERLIAETAGRGKVRIAACDRIAELAAWGDFTAQHVCDAVAGLHPILPDIRRGCDLIAVVREPAHIHDASAVEQHRDFFERLRHEVNHPAFFFGQIVTALGQRVLAVLARRAAENDQCDVAVFRRLLRRFALQRHLVVAHRPVRPVALVDGILFRPVGIDRSEGLVNVDLIAGAQAFEDADFIRRVDVAAGAVADIEGVDLDTAEHADPFVFSKRQRPLFVFQQHDPLRAGLPGKAAQRFARSRALNPLHAFLRNGVDRHRDQAVRFCADCFSKTHLDDLPVAFGTFAVPLSLFLFIIKERRRKVNRLSCGSDAERP